MSREGRGCAAGDRCGMCGSVREGSGAGNGGYSGGMAFLAAGGGRGFDGTRDQDAAGWRVGRGECEGAIEEKLLQGLPKNAGSE